MNTNTVSQLSFLDEAKTKNESSVVIRFSGSISYESTNTIVEKINTVLLQHPMKVVVDFREVDMIDSSGIRALLQGRKLCEEAGADFELSEVSEYAARIITMSGLAKAFGLNLAGNQYFESSNCDEHDLPETGWNTREYVVASDASLISVLREAVNEAAVEAGASGDILCDIQIAVGEALTNAYRHGSPKKGVSKIALRYMTCSKAVIIEIQDEGIPFNPNNLAVPDPNQMKDHGMGIYLMRNAMDIVEFSTNCPGNKVRMIKWLNDGDCGFA